ncbi:MAG TPA: hypothetical protein DCY79_18540, partial [Planctomycetaceae bacterium]|nr:hypothetical protein [Planctomycetaceae bacterium]
MTPFNGASTTSTQVTSSKSIYLSGCCTPLLRIPNHCISACGNRILPPLPAISTSDQARLSVP